MEGDGLKEGEVVKVKIISIREFGFYVKFNEFKGFVQPIDVNWCQEDEKTFSVDDEINVFIKSVTNEMFYASIKDADIESNPWKKPLQFSIGSLYLGNIVNIVDWGIVVRIVRNVKGMIITDKIDEYKINESISVKIIKIDEELKKITLEKS